MDLRSKKGKTTFTISIGKYARQKALTIGLSAAVVIGGYSYLMNKAYQISHETKAISQMFGISPDSAVEYRRAIKKAQKYAKDAVKAANIAYDLKVYNVANDLLDIVEQLYLEDSLPEKVRNLRSLLEEKGY